MPLLIDGQFPGYDPLTYAFLGPLVGSIARPFGGWLSDRVGGAQVTLVVFALMALATPGIILALNAGSFGFFLGTFLLLFVLAGMANGSVFRIVPGVFRRLYPEDRARALRETSAALGFTSAVAAYGGFLIPQAFKESIGSTGEPNLALYGFLVYYVVCMTVTWAFFLRGARAEKVREFRRERTAAAPVPLTQAAGQGRQ
jgi:NNP family nitrate/nitrite transporter-like MFS transporter